MTEQPNNPSLSLPDTPDAPVPPESPDKLKQPEGPPNSEAPQSPPQSPETTAAGLAQGACCVSALTRKVTEGKYHRPTLLVWLLGTLFLMLVLFGIVLYGFLPQNYDALRETIGYLAYLFPLMAVIVAGRGLIVDEGDKHADQRALSAFFDSLGFLVVGGVFQVSYQLDEPVALWLGIQLSFLCLVALAAIEGIRETKHVSKRRRAILFIGAGVVAFMLIGFMWRPEAQSAFGITKPVGYQPEAIYQCLLERKRAANQEADPQQQSTTRSEATASPNAPKSANKPSKPGSCAMPRDSA